MFPFPLIYHDDFDLHLGVHVFPSQKYRLIRDALLAENLAAPADFLTPDPAPDEDILRVHTPAYIHKLKTATLTPEDILRLEAPYSPELVRACWLAAGASTLAGRLALQHGFAATLSGGLHHAFPDHGEGFCMIHDVAVAIRRLQHDGAIRTAITIDTDVHHGNGTAAIFAADDSVFTLSIHQKHNYPREKPPSDIDIHLPDRTADADYLAILEKNLIQAFHDFSPDLVFYLGGADPYVEDQLGGLALTLDGLRRRDALVFEHARRHRVPVAITLAGGYARRLDDTIRIHINTLLAARDLAAKFPIRIT